MMSKNNINKPKKEEKIIRLTIISKPSKQFKKITQDKLIIKNNNNIKICMKKRKMIQEKVNKTNIIMRIIFKALSKMKI